jgi:hypothetical protein
MDKVFKMKARIERLTDSQVTLIQDARTIFQYIDESARNHSICLVSAKQSQYADLIWNSFEGHFDKEMQNTDYLLLYKGSVLLIDEDIKDARLLNLIRSADDTELKCNICYERTEMVSLCKQCNFAICEPCDKLNTAKCSDRCPQCRGGGSPLRGIAPPHPPQEAG